MYTVYTCIVHIPRQLSWPSQIQIKDVSFVEKARGIVHVHVHGIVHLLHVHVPAVCEECLWMLGGGGGEW